MNEQTLIKVMALPHGQRWAWFADANVLALSPDVRGEEERERAIDEAVAHWRRNLLEVIQEPSPRIDDGPLDRLPVAELTPWHTSDVFLRASGMLSFGTRAVDV